MAVVDGFIHPNYFIKSIIKIFFFLILPLLYFILNKEINIRTIFKFNLKSLLFSGFLGIVVYFLIIGAYFLFKQFVDFSNVTTSITKSIGVDKDDFIFVAIYISFINSLLEEFFFRGIAFLTLKKSTKRLTAYLISSGAFALYHVAIMTSWFSLPFYLLLIFSLMIGGFIFNFVDEKTNNIYPSWMIHMCANFAINTVGLFLFGII